MARLYIVDHSLVNRGGHHYDYTTCIADAGAAMGFDTVVVANRKLDSEIHFPNAVLYRAFENTVYQRDSYLEGLRQLKRCRFDLLDSPSDTAVSLSRLRNFYQRRKSQQRRIRLIRQFSDDCRQFFSSHLLHESDHVFFTTVSELEMLGLADYLSSDPTTVLPTWHLQFHFNLFDGRTPEYASQSGIEKLTRKCFETAFHQISNHRVRCHTTSLPLAQQYNRLNVCEVTPLPYPVAPQFASKLALAPGSESAGCRSTNSIASKSRSVQGTPGIKIKSKGSNLHLPHSAKNRSVIRESTGGSWNRESSCGHEDATQSELSQSGHQTSIGLGDPFEREDSRRTLRFTCPGQIRREKGCVQYLQPLVDALWQSHLVNGKIKIAVQRPKRKRLRKQRIELSVPQSGHNQLGHNPLDRNRHDHNHHVHNRNQHDSSATTQAIEYFEHPLGRDSYIDFIKNTDCGLLFYDSRTYYSRRAGVLGELLSAGKPLIVSAGSWLSEQIAEPNFQWAQRLRSESISVETLKIEDVNYSGKNVPSAGGVVSFDRYKHPFRFSLLPNKEAQILMFSFDWKFPIQSGTFAGIELKQKDADGNCIAIKRNVVGHRQGDQSPNCVFRLHRDAATIEIALKNEFSDATASFRNIQMEMLTMKSVESSDEIPLSSVGIIAADRKDLVAAVTEMVNHYDHYQLSANEFSRHWFARHNPVRSVAHLIANPW